MKTNSFSRCIIAFAFAISSLGFTAHSADVVLNNFESPTALGSLPGGSTWTGSAIALNVEANPLVAGINTTAQVATSTRTLSQNGTFQAEFNIASMTYTGVKYIHIMVLKPKQSVMKLAGRQQAPDAGYQTYNDRFSVYSYYTDVENQWVDAVFKVDFGTSLRIDRLVFSLDIAVPTALRYSGDTKLYFDEIIVNDDAQPRGDATVYTAPKALSLPENFENTVTIVDKRYFGIFYTWKNGGVNNETPTEAVVANPAKNSVNQSDKVLKMIYRSTFSWDSWLQVILNQGAGMNVDATNKYLHIMVNKNADNEFAISTRVVSGAESGWVRATAPNYAKANGWQDMVFEIPAGNFGLINQMNINGHTTSPGATDLPVYIDEIEFSGTATPRTIFNVAKAYDFGANAANGTYTYSLPITAGALLTGNLTFSIAGDAAFTTTTTTLTQAQIAAGTATINLTYKPTSLGSKTATLSIASNGVTLAQVGVAGTGGAPNEAINVDFEAGTFFATNPANDMYGGVGSALTIVDNPSKTGLNTSNKVAMGVRSASGNENFYAEFNIEPTVINTTRYLHVLVLKPTHSVMSFNGRNNYPVTGNSWDNIYSATHSNYTTVVNQWVDVVFKIVGNGSKIDRLIIGLDICNPATRYATNANIYFDQVLLNDSPLPRGIAALPTKKTTFPEDFEGTSYVGDATYFPYTYSWITPSSHPNYGSAYESVVANPMKNGVNGSEKVFKTTLNAGADWWTRIQFDLNDGLGTAVSVANKYFHVMFYKTGTGGEVKLFFIKTDGTKAEWISPTSVYAYNGWQDLVFEVPVAVFGDIKTVGILPHGGTATNIDVYMDNIEFSSSLAPRTSFGTGLNSSSRNMYMFVENGQLNVKGIEAGYKINVSNLIGQSIFDGISTGETFSKTMANKGVMIVTIVGNGWSKSSKVIVK